MICYHLRIGWMWIREFILESSFSCGTHKYVGCGRFSVLPVRQTCTTSTLFSAIKIVLYQYTHAFIDHLFFFRCRFGAKPASFYQPDAYAWRFSTSLFQQRNKQRLACLWTSTFDKFLNRGIVIISYPLYVRGKRNTYDKNSREPRGSNNGLCQGCYLAAGMGNGNGKWEMKNEEKGKENKEWGIGNEQWELRNGE